MQLNKIYNENCLDFLKKIPDAFVDVCFADPPFNLNKKYDTYNDKKLELNYIEESFAWLSELIRVTKDTGSIFIHNIPYWLLKYSEVLNDLAHFKHWITWDAPTTPMGKSLQPANYGILYYAKDIEKNKFYEIRHPHKRCRSCKNLLKDYGGKKDTIHPFGPLISDVWTDIHRVKHSKYRDKHPCQLPIHLLERIILMSSDENDIVLDPFLGTGTTAIASKRLGREFIGCDISTEYVDLANNKLNLYNNVSQINNIYLSVYLKDIYTIRNCDIIDKNNNYKENFKNLFLEFPNNKEDFRKISFQKINFNKETKNRLNILS